MLHLSLEYQVPQVSLFGEPDEKLSKGGLDRLLPGLVGHEETRDVAGTSYSFNPAEKVSLGCGVITAILITQFLHLEFVGRTQVLSNDLFGDIPADVLPIVTWFFHPYLFLFRLEDLGEFYLVIIGRRTLEDQIAVAITRGSDELPEDGIIGLLTRQPIGRDNQVLLRIVKIELLL